MSNGEFPVTHFDTRHIMQGALKLLSKTPKNVPGLYCVISVVYKKERNRRLIALQLSYDPEGHKVQQISKYTFISSPEPSRVVFQ